jgi:hypothetical protein
VCWIGSGLDELDDEKKLGWRVVRWMFLYLLDEPLAGYLFVGTISPVSGESRCCGEGRYSVLLHGRVCYGDANP